MANVFRYFDESIFTNCGFTLQPYDYVSVTNRADAWLVEKLGKTAVKSYCTSSIPLTISDKNHESIPTEKIANLNPHIPCIGINIYSLNDQALESLIVLPFYQITVSDEVGKQKIQITDNYSTDEIFTINDELTHYESAIMVKYYSKKNPITIDYKLYHIINKHLKTSNQSLYKYSNNINDQKYAIATYRLNVINFNFTSPPILI